MRDELILAYLKNFSLVVFKMLCIIFPQILHFKMNIFSLLWLVVAEEERKPCSYAEFRCENGPCIPRRKRCDGKVDCPLDPSDELDCCKLQNLEERNITYYHHVLLTVVSSSLVRTQIVMRKLFWMFSCGFGKSVHSAAQVLSEVRSINKDGEHQCCPYFFCWPFLFFCVPSPDGNLIMPDLFLNIC